jgi:uncharacterized glyoxalase superfamily protein PhnB
MMQSNRSIPKATVIPVLGYPSVGEAVEWLSTAFGFTLRLRIGDHRGQLNVGEGAIAVTEESYGASLARVLVRVEDADQHCARAREHGAKILQPPTNFPYGERQYSAQDPAGHQWTFSQSIADVDPATWGGVIGRL